MKKRLALLLAVVMTFTTMLSFNVMNVTAAPEISITGKLYNYKDGSLVPDLRLSPAPGDATLLQGAAASEFSKGIAGNGTGGSGIDLMIRFREGNVASGTSFMLTLSGAEFAYYDNTASMFTGVAGNKSFTSPLTATNLTSAGYVRESVLSYAGAGSEQSYTMIAMNEKTAAQVTISGAQIKDKELRIPLVLKTKTDGAVTLTITDISSGIVSSPVTYTLSTSGAGTTAYAGSVKDGRAYVDLDRLYVREKGPGSFKNGGYFYLETPSGYQFKGDTSTSTVKIYSSNFNASGGSGAFTSPITIYASKDAARGYVASTNSYTNTPVNADGKNVTATTVAYYDEDYTRIVVAFGTNVSTVSQLGYVYFEGLRVVTEDGDEPTYKETYKLAVKNKDAGVTEESFDAFKFMTWSLAYTAADAKTIKAGAVGDGSKITVQEETPDSWWTSRETLFTLVDADGNKLDGVKIAKATYKLSNTTNNDDSNKENTTALYNTGDFYFSKDAASFGFASRPVKDKTSKVKVELTLKISADVNFEGDVYVAISGYAIPGGSDYIQNGGIVKIATVEKRVELAAKTTAVYIGYQRYDVADVTATELKEGMLERGKDLQLKIGMFGTTSAADISFVPIKASQISITGDAKITPTLTTSATSQIDMTVDRTSKTASSITFSGLQVYINRSVPNGVYELYLDGSAVRENGELQLNNKVKSTDAAYKRWSFDTEGIVLENYIKVATEGSDKAFTKEVKIYQNSKTIIVDGVAQEMEVATINVDGRLYVPLRFVTQALGATGESAIVWDEGTGNVQITINDKTCTWTKDSEYYVAAGVRMSMTESGVVSKAFISDDGRMYIPFRYIGYAFNIPVTYDDASGAAVYNAK